MHLSLLSLPQRLWLLILVALWGALLFGGFIFGPTRNNRRIPRWARIASSLTLAVAGWTWWLFAAGTTVSAYAFFIAMGMSFGVLGDMAIAHLLGLRGSRATMGGIAAFGMGHLFYISGILQVARTFHLTDPMTLLGSTGAMWGVAAMGWWLVVIRGQRRLTILHWAALPYALLLATTAGLALGLTLQQSLFWPLALGAFLFLLSDLILAGALFSHLEIPLIHDIVWLTYGPGQMLIVFSVGAAMLLAG